MTRRGKEPFKELCLCSRFLRSSACLPAPHCMQCSDPHELVKVLRKGDVGAMELVAMEIKQAGSYIARTLSYEVGRCWVEGGPQRLLQWPGKMEVQVTRGCRGANQAGSCSARAPSCEVMQTGHEVRAGI